MPRIKPGEGDRQSSRARHSHMKERLHLTEAFYHSLVENLPQFIIRKDLEGRFTFANKRFCETLGKSLDEVVGKTDHDLYPADLADKYRQDDLRVIASGQSYDIEEANQVPGKDTMYVRVVKIPIRDRVGKVVGVQGIFWDVTEQKRAAQALVEQSHLLGTLMDNLPDLIYFKDKNSRFTRINRAHAAAMGLADPAAAAGKSDADFLPAEQAEQCRRDEKAVMASLEPMVGKEETITLPDGTVKWYSTTKMPFRNRSGRVIGTFGISRDITDRKRVELSLLEQLELFTCFMDSLPDCVYFKDRESRFTRVNKFLVQRFGLGDPAALLGKNDFDLFTEEHARPAYEDEQEILRTGTPIIGKVEKETFPDGSVSWASTTKIPHRDPFGRIVGTFGVSRDITDWKRAEEQLAEQANLLNTMMENSPDSIYFKDREGRFLWISRAMAVRHGLADPAGARGKTDFDFFPEAHARHAREIEQEILRTGQPVVGRIEKRTLPDGSIRKVSTTKVAFRDKDGNILGTFGITRDITGEKEGGGADDSRT
jgi:two-component system sensor histidine kinase/response regulator